MLSPLVETWKIFVECDLFWFWFLIFLWSVGHRLFWRCFFLFHFFFVFSEEKKFCFFLLFFFFFFFFCVLVCDPKYYRDRARYDTFNETRGKRFCYPILDSNHETLGPKACALTTLANPVLPFWIPPPKIIIPVSCNFNCLLQRECEQAP